MITSTDLHNNIKLNPSLSILSLMLLEKSMDRVQTQLDRLSGGGVGDVSSGQEAVVLLCEVHHLGGGMATLDGRIPRAALSVLVRVPLGGHEEHGLLHAVDEVEDRAAPDHLLERDAGMRDRQRQEVLRQIAGQHVCTHPAAPKDIDVCVRFRSKYILRIICPPAVSNEVDLVDSETLDVLGYRCNTRLKSLCLCGISSLKDKRENL